MRIRARTLWIASIALLLAPDASAGTCARAEFPESVAVGDVVLMLNGTGLREVSLVGIDVYRGGLYLANPSRDAAAILSARRPMRLGLHFLRDVGRDRIAGGIGRAFERSGSDPALWSDRFDRLDSWLTDMRAGDELAFTFLPETGLRVEVRGRTRGVIEGADFARVLFGNWLGEAAVDASVRDGLLGGACG
jgi:hypothetical protein